MLVYTPRLRTAKRPKGISAKRKLRRAVLLASDPSCYYCGAALTEKTATIDHVLPLSKGGTWADDNTVLACAACNNAKGDTVPEGVPTPVAPVAKRRRRTGRGVIELRGKE